MTLACQSEETLPVVGAVRSNVTCSDDMPAVVGKIGAGIYIQFRRCGIPVVWEWLFVKLW